MLSAKMNIERMLIGISKYQYHNNHKKIEYHDNVINKFKESAYCY